MITSYFSPKGSSKKRPRDQDHEGENDDSASNKGIDKTGKRLTTPVSSSSRNPDKTPALVTPGLSRSASKLDENARKSVEELLSYLKDHSDLTDGKDSGDLVYLSWKSALQPLLRKQKFVSLAKFVQAERQSKTVYPPPQLTFSALNLTPLHKVKVVIVGQDPYHAPNQAHGLAFSVSRNIAIPPSLRNMYKELVNDPSVPLFTTIPKHGNLERWAKQGVLMLNNVLTVRRGEPASHAKKGWEEFTDGVIDTVLQRCENGGIDKNADDGGNDEGKGVVFLLWGKPASAKATTVLSRHRKSRSRHAVICCSHPSPLGATKTSSPFMGSRCFGRANEELKKRGWKEVDWRVDGELD